MDPTTLIITALATGASAAANETASTAIKDSYEGLKTLIKRKLAGKPDAQELLEGAQDSEKSKKLLREVISASEISSDQEVLKSANDVLKQAETYQIKIRDSKAFVVHNEGTVNMNIKEK